MKRLLTILSFIIIFSSPLWAQQALTVERFFETTQTGDADVVTIDISDRKINGHNVDRIRILSIKNGESLSEEIARDVIKDGLKASSKEVSYKDKKLMFGFYAFVEKSKQKRYILFRRDKAGTKTTLILIKGDITAEDVMNMINKS